METFYYLMHSDTGEIHNRAFLRISSALNELRTLGDSYECFPAEVPFIKRSVCYVRTCVATSRGIHYYENSKFFSCSDHLMGSPERDNVIEGTSEIMHVKVSR